MTAAARPRLGSERCCATTTPGGHPPVPRLLLAGLRRERAGAAADKRRCSPAPPHTGRPGSPAGSAARVALAVSRRHRRSAPTTPRAHARRSDIAPGERTAEISTRPPVLVVLDVEVCPPPPTYYHLAQERRVDLVTIVRSTPAKSDDVVLFASPEPTLLPRAPGSRPARSCSAGRWSRRRRPQRECTAAAGACRSGPSTDAAGVTVPMAVAAAATTKAASRVRVGMGCVLMPSGCRRRRRAGAPLLSTG